ncbi:MAG: molybdopterin-dependent oxidoreductase [Deltaproteobacteria bacterium]|nr:molybdopterin-dependent oxidoreductase [Deltaproteobacteria bacterium]
MVKNTPTICSFCSNGCGMFIRSDGKEAIGCLPMTLHPVSEGRLCHRGWNRFQNLRSFNRLSLPLVREGSNLKEVTWPEALQKTTEKISELLSRYGPQSLGVIGSPWLTNEDNYRIARFSRDILGTNHLDGSYRFSGAAALAALNQLFSGSFGSLGSIPAIAQTPTILVIGKECCRDFSPVGSRLINAFLHGSTVILADPLCTRKEHFFKYLLPHPIQSLAAAFRDKESFPPEVSAHLFQPGLALIFLADQVDSASSLVSLLQSLSPRPPTENPLPLMIPLSRSPNLKGAWDMGIQPGEGGLTLQEMLDEESPVKGLILFGDDLLNHLPTSSMLVKFKNLEFVLVADRFFTETARMAHCVLPIPLLAETRGTMTNSEGRVQKLRPFLGPQKENRPVADILYDLSRRLGKDFPVFSELEVRREISKNISPYTKVASESDLEEVGGILLPAPTAPLPCELPEAAEQATEENRYRLLVPNTLYAWNRNQMIHESPVLRMEYPSDRPAVRMNPLDAKELKIRMGEKAKVRSDRGEAQVPVEVDENIPSKVLMLPSHFVEVVESLAGKAVRDVTTRTLFFPILSVTVEKL